jgi:hypothetical protein
MNIGKYVTDLPANLLTKANVNAKSIVIPENVRRVDPASFNAGSGEASVLETVELNANLDITTGGAFPMATIKTLLIGPNVTVIRNGDFANTQIDRVDLKNVTIIEDGAFSGSSINELTIPASVVSIGTSAFANTASLQIVIFAPRTIATSGLVIANDNSFLTGSGGAKSLKAAYEDTSTATPGGPGRYAFSSTAGAGWYKTP